MVWKCFLDSEPSSVRSRSFKTAGLDLAQRANLGPESTGATWCYLVFMVCSLFEGTVLTCMTQ